MLKSPMNQPKRTDNTIVVLGCGISGMITALGFAEHGIKTSIIESKSVSAKGFFSDIRTTAFTSNSKRFLNLLGIWSAIEQKSGRILDIYVIDNKVDRLLHMDLS